MQKPSKIHDNLSPECRAALAMLWDACLRVAAAAEMGLPPAD